MSAANDIEISTNVENANGGNAMAIQTTTAMPASTTTATTTVTMDTPAQAPPVPTFTSTATIITAPTMASVKPDTTDSVTIVTGENGSGNAPAGPQQQQQQQQQMQSATDKDKMDSDAALTNFKVLYVLAQLCGLTMIVLMGSWIGAHMGGLAGTDNPRVEFNWHPLLMTIGLIFLYGNSILVYRGFRTARKKALKITHASIHGGAFILTVIALKTVFDSHNLLETPIPNMYSLHSWLGLGAVILFCMQYVAGFVAYLWPGVRNAYRVALMPLHIYFGLFGFVLAIASALMGLTEKAIFAIPNYSSLPSSGVMANMCGVLYVIFGGLVVYLITEPSYKRKPIPEDTVLLTGNNE